MYSTNLKVCLYSQEWLAASLAGAAGMSPLINARLAFATDGTDIEFNSEFCPSNVVPLPLVLSIV